MINYQCVKCGASLVNTTLDFTNRLCAPCCADCREAVTKEVKKNFSMWPHEYRGGWLWDGKSWCVARRMDGTQK